MGERTFELADTTLTFVRVDFQTRLQFGRSEVIIETPFRLVVGGGTHDLDPNERAGLGPLLALYPDALADLTMSSRGTLTATFARGAVVTIEPDERYEAWSVDGFSCPPGGFSI